MQSLGLEVQPGTACDTSQRTVSDRVCTPNSTVVGYMGGTGKYPTYQNYTTANNFSETVRLVYDEAKLPFDTILDAYWQYAPDPTEPQPDPAYQLRMFYVDEAQRSKMLASIAAKRKSTSGQVLIDVFAASDYIFWKAEEYHQNYFAKSGMGCQNKAKARGGSGAGVDALLQSLEAMSRRHATID